MELGLASGRTGFGSGVSPKLMFWGSGCLGPGEVVLIEEGAAVCGKG